MGVGKTTIANQLSLKLSLPYYDTDIIIEKQEKKSIRDIFQQNGEAYFRKIERILLDQMNQKGVFACGGGSAIYKNNMDIINKKGLTIYLKASTKYLHNRLKGENKNRPLIYNFTDLELYKYIKKELKIREPYYMKSKYCINIEKKDISQILTEINTLI